MTGMIGSESTASANLGRNPIRQALRTWLVFGLVSTLMTVTACSGGGFNGNNNTGGTASLAAGVNTVTTATATNGDSAVRVDFTVQGVAGQAVTLLFQYYIDQGPAFNGMRDSNEPLMDMTEASMALQAILGITSEGGMQVPLTIPANGVLTGTFLWLAGADLGFIGQRYGVVITPSSTISGQTTTAGETTTSATYNAGNAPASVMVANNGGIGGGGAATGRTSHTAELVSDLSSNASMSDLGNEVVLVGGNNSAIDLNSVDRFSIDFNARTATPSMAALTSQSTRRQHATASFFSGTNIRVLVCGGSVSGTPTTTADIYSFGPNGAESVAATGAMNSARSQFSACWLPDNRVFVHGGADAGNMAQNSAEIFDPVAGTFTALTVPGTVPARLNHSCSLLPNGTVLVAGGTDGMGAAINAFIYNPKTDTWTDTGVQVDRVGHSATMLVNGICALIGGQNAMGATLNTVTFYRTFADTFNSVAIPAGFTTVSATALATARSGFGSSRLGDGSVLVTGGLDSGSNTLATSELFVPSKFTDPAIGFFTQTNPGAMANMDMSDSRANHTQTTTGSGSAVVMGGISGSLALNTVLDTIEVFQFQNAAPSVSGISASGGLGDVSINFTLTDAESDCSFVIFRYSTDGGTNFQFATLTDYRGTVNLLPGARTIHWNASADGISSLTGVVVEIIPVGGVVGAPARATL